MKLIRLVTSTMQYLSEAVGHIFAPNDDHYPATGALPFQGDPNYASLWLD
ncbi:MAG: hypothetical protein HC934_11785 [Acaryochloridaceae cyanobacterium SU_2_1]|nr:hypothetical protein [Acaryochloridaceae cyanobacterium SU_2_1]